MSAVVKVHRKGLVVLPKALREKVGIKEGMLLLCETRDGEIILKPLDLWERVWKSAKGSAEEVEMELDLDEVAREERVSSWGQKQKQKQKQK